MSVVSLGLPEHPYFMRRAARAMDLLDTGKVNFVGDEIFRVHSQFDDQIYHVELNHGTPGCTCADHQKNPGILCKHMIAATIYSKQVARNEAITLVKTTDGNESDFWRRCWLIAQGNRRTLVYEEPDGRLFCTCGAYYNDCIHKQLVIQTVKSQLRFVNECGTEQAKQLQDKLNSQLDSQGSNGNGAKAPSLTGGFSTVRPAKRQSSVTSQITTPTKLDLSDPFQESESYDIDQIEGRKNGELAWNINGKYVISYAGVMKLAEKHSIEFEEISVNDNAVIAKAKNGNERISGKPIYDNATGGFVWEGVVKTHRTLADNHNTALELAKRNCARQLLPLAEILAVQHKAKLNAEFSFKKAYDKCVKLVGGKAQLDCIIFDLVNWGKLRQDNPSHYNRTEWLLIHEYCQKEASIERDPKSTNNWSYNSAVFIERCKEAIEQVREEDVGLSPDKQRPKVNTRTTCVLPRALFHRFVNSDNHTITTKSIEANEMPSEKSEGVRKLQMDKKLRTWLIEADGTKKEISCREICEQFENKTNPRIVTRLRAGIDDGADISTVELDD